jgi:3-oxoadipate enol-lactonase
VIRLSDGGIVEYDILGPERRALAALPVVLIPSAGGSRRAWGAFRERLGSDLVTIALDPRGFGSSSRPRRFFSTRSLARDIDEAMRHLGIDKATVLGVSLGGMIATWLAIDAPERVSRLVLASTAARGLHFSPRRLADALRMARCFGERDPRPCLADEIAAGGEGRKRPPVRRAASRARGRYRTLRLTAAALGHTPHAAIGQIRMPTLLIAGAQDPILPVSAQRYVLERLPHAELSVVSDAGHDVLIEAPERCAADVLRFVAQH